MGKSIIVADLHLEENDIKRNDMFQKLCMIFKDGDFEKMIILGDFFSTFVSLKDTLSPYQEDILSLLKGIGKKIVYVMGNRDYYLEENEELPFSFVGRIYEDVFNGKRVVFEHGDEINRDDIRYLFWKDISRTFTVKDIFSKLPSHFKRKAIEKLESELSKTNLKHKVILPLKHIKNRLNVLKKEGYFLFILGHFHQRLTISEKEIRCEIVEEFYSRGYYATLDNECNFEDNYLTNN